MLNLTQLLGLMSRWLAGRLVGLLVCRLSTYLAAWLAGCLVGWLIGQLSSFLAGWLVGWLVLIINFERAGILVESHKKIVSLYDEISPGDSRLFIVVSIVASAHSSHTLKSAPTIV